MHHRLRKSAAWHSARKVDLPHYLRYLTSQARYGDETHCDKSADSDSRRILTLMFQAGQQSGEVDTPQAAAPIAWSFEYLLFGAIAAWLADPRLALTKRFLAAFDLAMPGLADRQRTRLSSSH